MSSDTTATSSPPQPKTSHTRRGSSPNFSQNEILRRALYHAAIFIFAIGCVCSVIGAYYLFLDFVKPLMWAVISGITLYPLKRKLSNTVQAYLDGLVASGTPLTLALLTSPLQILDTTAEFMLHTFTTNLPLVLGIGVCFPLGSLILHYKVIPQTMGYLATILSWSDKLIKALAFKAWVPCLMLYWSYVILCGAFPSIKCRLVSPAVSTFLWYGAFIYLSNLFGPLRAPILLGLTVVFFGYELLLAISAKTPSDMAETEEELVDEAGGDPDRYLKWLAIACAFVYVSQRLWLTLLLLIPLTYGILKRIAHVDLAQAFDLLQLCKELLKKSKLEEATLVILPNALRQFFAFLAEADRTVLSVGWCICIILIMMNSQDSLKTTITTKYCIPEVAKDVIAALSSSLHVVGSIAAMASLALGMLLISTFVATQLYYESAHLIGLATEVANRTFADSQPFQKWLRETAKVNSVGELAEHSVHQCYTYGKSYIGLKVKELVGEDDEKAAQIETQVVATLEAMYKKLIASHNTTTENSTALAGTDDGVDWLDLWDFLTGSDSLLQSALATLQENMETIWTLVRSATAVIWSSSEVIVGSLTDVLSVVFSSGYVLVAFLLDMTVFLTFLFTLLCESEEEFLPMKFLRENMPHSNGKGAGLLLQVEEAVSGVFLATLKMAVFYGLFTWLTHTLLAVHLVFVPSVVAAMFAAVPFFGTYLVAIPAVLELYLVKGEKAMALLLFLAHYIPSYFVDDAIFSQINSTNPFLTGMAIAGGMLWWGLEGAIFGPIILCVFIIMGTLYRMLIDQENVIMAGRSIKRRGKVTRNKVTGSESPTTSQKEEGRRELSKFQFSLDFVENPTIATAGN